MIFVCNYIKLDVNDIINKIVKKKLRRLKFVM